MCSETKLFSEQEKSVLSILENNVSIVLNTIDTLESKARHNFTMLSAIATVVTTINLSILNIITTEMIIALIVMAVLYVIVAIISIVVLLPRSMESSPIGSSWDDIKYWWELESSEYPSQLLANYSEIDKRISKVMSCKACLVKISYVLTGFAIAVALAEAVIYWLQFIR